MQGAWWRKVVGEFTKRVFGTLMMRPHHLCSKPETDYHAKYAALNVERFHFSATQCVEVRSVG